MTQILAISGEGLVAINPNEQSCIPQLRGSLGIVHHLPGSDDIYSMSVGEKLNLFQDTYQPSTDFRLQWGHRISMGTFVSVYGGPQINTAALVGKDDWNWNLHVGAKIAAGSPLPILWPQPFSIGVEVNNLADIVQNSHYPVVSLVASMGNFY